MSTKLDPLGILDTPTTETSAWKLDNTDNCPKCNNIMEALSGANDIKMSVCFGCRITLPRRNA